PMKQLGKGRLHRGGMAEVDRTEPREIAVLLALQDSYGYPRLVLEVVVEGADAHAGESTDLLHCRDCVPTFGKGPRRRFDQSSPGLLGLAPPLGHILTIPNPTSVTN